MFKNKKRKKKSNSSSSINDDIDNDYESSTNHGEEFEHLISRRSIVKDEQDNPHEILEQIQDDLHGLKPATYRPEKRRWLVLFVFVCVTSLQGLVWITFNANPKEVKQYYALGSNADSQLDLLLNWSPIAYVLVCPLVMLALNQGGRAVWNVQLAGALFVAVGSCVRLIPTFASFQQKSSAIYFLHLGQFLNGIAGPMAGSAPSAFSAMWFPAEQRTLATSLAYIPQVLGPCVGFLIAQLVHDSYSLEHLLYAEFGVAAAAMLIWLATPALPDLPPSATAEEFALVLEPGLSAGLKHYYRMLGRTCKNLSFLMLSLSGGIVTGVFNVWTGDLADTLEDQLGEGLSQWLGFVSDVANFLGTIAIGPIAERWFPKKMKLLICLLYLAQLVGYAVFTLSLPLGTVLAQPLLPLPGPALLGVLCFASACLGAATPLFYELGAEMTFPASEGISAGVISTLDNGGGVAILFVMASIPKAWDSCIMFFAVAASLFLMLFVRETYKRRGVDNTHKFSAHIPEGSTRSILSIRSMRGSRAYAFKEPDEDDDDEDANNNNNNNNDDYEEEERRHILRENNNNGNYDKDAEDEPLRASGNVLNIE